MIGNRLASLVTVMVFVLAAPVQAAQPLVTDDAAVVAPKTCQLEAWTRSAHDGRVYGAQPACNITGNLELAVGGARANPDAGESSNIVQLQAKTVLFERDDRVWSFGMHPATRSSVSSGRSCPPNPFSSRSKRSFAASIRVRAVSVLAMRCLMRSPNERRIRLYA